MPRTARQKTKNSKLPSAECCATRLHQQLASCTMADSSENPVVAEAPAAPESKVEASGEAAEVVDDGTTFTHQVIDTVLTADCIEVPPSTFPDCEDVVVLGTYQLNTETRVKSGQITVYSVRTHGGCCRRKSER